MYLEKQKKKKITRILSARNEMEYKQLICKLDRDLSVEGYFSIKKRSEKLGLYYFVYVNPSEKMLNDYKKLKEKQRKIQEAKQLEYLKKQKLIKNTLDSFDSAEEDDDDNEPDEFQEETKKENIEDNNE